MTISKNSENTLLHATTTGITPDPKPEAVPKPKPKRRKTTRACQHCHKTHMTCDEGRPCKRCVARGLQDTCVDAPRKRKKYLLDLPEDVESPSFRSSSQTPVNHHEVKQETFGLDTQHGTTLNDLYPPQIIPKNLNESYQYSLGFQEIRRQDTDHGSSTGNTKSSKFMSNAANNEYSILSDIIKQDYQLYGNSGNLSESTVSPPTHPTTHDLNSAHNLRQNSMNSMKSGNSTPTPTSTPSVSQHDIYHFQRLVDKSINQYKLGMIQEQVITYPEVMKAVDGELAISRINQHSQSSQKNIQSVLSFSIAINENFENGAPTSENSHGLRFREPEDIYARIDKPFSYTPGFHSLIQYLRQRFNATDLIKMAKSMASYRPSFIACTNTLKEEDLIFMEQCFQRTLLEYDKFISISGTPTIVWRRTGQIAYVSEEFSILTGWTRDDLLNKMTFIVELMDDRSVIEYFDLFSTIAYGDFKAATMGSCTLLTPDSSSIKTTCIWTLKRDVFGIPMMIIGNFLPILQ